MHVLYAYVHTLIHTYIPAYIHNYIRAEIDTYTHTHTYIHTYINTHTQDASLRKPWHEDGDEDDAFSMASLGTRMHEQHKALHWSARYGHVPTVSLSYMS